MDEVWAGIKLEFADLFMVKEVVRLSVRLILALLLGGIIGLERELSGKPAGLRTHMLVCLGTCFFMAVPERSGMPLADLSRIIQGITAGIGFLGAGTIIKHEDKSKIEGLTTAASIWFTAAVGVAVGLGRDASAVLATLMAMGILCFMPQQNKKNGNEN